MTEIDDFLSHDWGTSRFMKFVALLFYYNSNSAIMCTLVVCAMLAALECAGQLGSELKRPYSLTVAGCRVELLRSVWPMVICPILFLVVLLFGQRIRLCLSSLGHQEHSG